MAIMQHDLIFGDVHSSDYGIYISGEGVFDAPKRDVEMISIPGRNGAFVLDKGRFENITVTYPAFNRESDLETFTRNLDAFRNAICAQGGYQRLTDSFHPDEYRMATYNSGLEVKPIKYNTAAEFDIVFDCKPQRYLMSGESAIDVSSGDTILNPTLFEARPMLEVEGYGNIQFNGYNIDLENAAMGDIVLADPKTETSRSYFSITFKNGQFNAGDVITLNGALFKWYQDTSGAILSSVSSITHSNNKFSTSYSGTASSTSPATTTVQSLTFAAGTDSTVTDTMTLVGTRSGSTVRLYVTTEITYTYEWTTGMSRIYFSTWKSSSTTDPVSYHVNSVSHLGARGTSTVSILGHPTYIDCDLGEVYMIKDGSAISLNAYVDLGSDLPCLGVGANEFLYDNTVTDLKVIPRWWKV